MRYLKIRNRLNHLSRGSVLMEFWFILVYNSVFNADDSVGFAIESNSEAENDEVMLDLR